MSAVWRLRERQRRLVGEAADLSIVLTSLEAWPKWQRLLTIQVFDQRFGGLLPERRVFVLAAIDRGDLVITDSLKLCYKLRTAYMDSDTVLEAYTAEMRGDYAHEGGAA